MFYVYGIACVGCSWNVFAASLTLSDIFGWACCPDSDEVGSDRAVYFQLVAR